MAVKKKFIFDVGHVTISLVVALAASTLLKIFLARQLGPEGIGLYSLTNVFFWTLCMIGGLGLPSATVKYISEYETNKTKMHQMASSAITASLLLGILLTIILATLAPTIAQFFAKPALTPLLTLIALSLPFGLFSLTLQGIINGQRRMRVYAMLQIIRSALLLGLIAALVLYRPNVQSAITGFVGAEILIAIASAYAAKEFLLSLTFQKFLPSLKQNLSFSTQMIAGVLVNKINYQGDILLVGYFLSEAQLGYYALASSVTRLLWIIPTAVEKLSFPLISKLSGQNLEKKIQATVDRCMKYSVLLLGAIALTILYFAQPLITTLFGTQFLPAIKALQILSIAAVFTGTMKSVGTTYAAVGRPDIYLCINTTATAANIGFNLVLIPTYGIIGAAVASVISYALVFLLFLILLKKVTDITVDWKWLCEIALIQSIIGALLLYLQAMHVGITWDILAVALILGYLLYVAKHFTEKVDRHFMKTLLTQEIHVKP